ncbi:hypothetical protein Q7P35_011708 [Cladosporium inversicolor]
MSQSSRKPYGLGGTNKERKGSSTEGGDGRERAWQVTPGSSKTPSTGNGIGTPALRTADSDGIAAAMVPVPVLLKSFTPMTSGVSKKWIQRLPRAANGFGALNLGVCVTGHPSTTVPCVADDVLYIVDWRVLGVGCSEIVRQVRSQITCGLAVLQPSSPPALFQLSRASGARKSQPSSQHAASLDAAIPGRIMRASAYMWDRRIV